MFRTIQKQPRVVTLFTHNLESSHARSLLTVLRSDQSNNFDIEICQNFPTKDQLEYLSQIDKINLMKQIPRAETLLRKPAENPIFGSPLQKCVNKEGYWNKSSSMWVDWEKAVLGTTAESLKSKLMQKLNWKWYYIYTYIDIYIYMCVDSGTHHALCITNPFYWWHIVALEC